MGARDFIPLIGRLYRQRDSAREERESAIAALNSARSERDYAIAELNSAIAEHEAAFDSYRKDILNNNELIDLLVNKIPGNVPFPEWRKEAWLRRLDRRAKILDVGCGNDSPYHTKSILPDCYYVGVDISDYNQNKPNLADHYIVTSSDAFCQTISELEDSFDAVISSHNLEHCDDRRGTLMALAQALKRGGTLYLSFPCSDSISFPNRAGCLNYFDDPTHKFSPPDFAEVIAILYEQGLRVTYASTRYQSPIEWVVGLRNETDSAAEQKVKVGTWSLWGFETVIWAERP